MEITMKHKIALAQFEIKIGSPTKNIEMGLAYIDQAIDNECKLVLLPELWTSGYDLENRERYIGLNKELIADLQVKSNTHNILIGSSFITKDFSAFHNTFILIQPNNSITTHYHKVHLFKQLEEAVYFSSGEDFKFADFSIGRVGFAICYDVRFPEMFRVYSRNHVELVLVAAQWGAERAEHWRTLLRARAIENQCFVAAVNSVGLLREKMVAGYSAVITPWGDTLVEANAIEEKLLVAEIDLAMIKAISALIPSGKDARNDLYKKWIEE
jgi:omega-amidase